MTGKGLFRLPFLAAIENRIFITAGEDFFAMRHREGIERSSHEPSLPTIPLRSSVPALTRWFPMTCFDASRVISPSCGASSRFLFPMAAPMIAGDSCRAGGKRAERGCRLQRVLGRKSFPPPRYLAGLATAKESMTARGSKLTFGSRRNHFSPPFTNLNVS